MFKFDKKNNCSIFNGSFFDDIQPYVLEEQSSVLNIKYGSDISPVSFRWSSLTNVISNSLSLITDGTQIVDSWIPIIIDNDNHVLSKEIKNNCSIKKQILGIENFIQFKGLFNNWDISNNSIKLNSNWFIHSNDIPYIMDYGVLCWYKKNTQYKHTDFKSLQDFPEGTRLRCDQNLTAKLSDTESISISPDDILFKLSNTILIIANKDDSIFNNTTDANSNAANISFNRSDERRIFDLSKVQDISSINPHFKQDIEALYNDPLLLDGSLWIANGEAYSYSLNKNRRAENYSLNIPSMSYLSPGLFYIYNAIYHRLTIRLLKKHTGLLSVGQSRMLKKLCYFLSTAPIIDRTTVDILYDNDIQNQVTQLIAETIGDQDTEKKKLLESLVFIMKRFHSITNYSRTYSNLSTNYINNKTDLFYKIVQKYTPHLLINTDTDVVYKHLIDYGPNFSVRRIVKTICPKELKNQVDGSSRQNVIYNNEIIKCQGMSLSTNFGPNNSEILLSGTYPSDTLSKTPNGTWIPTADIVISPLGGDRDIDLGPDIKIALTSQDGHVDLSQDPPVLVAEKAFTINLQRDDMGNLLDSYYWELIDGPDCLRFSECGLDPNIKGRCAYTVRSRTSRDDSPVVYIRSRGLYTIKVTATSHFGINSDTLKIYVVDENGEYDQGLTPPSNAVEIEVESNNPNFVANKPNTSTYESNLIQTDYLKCLCLNMCQFAMSKTNGLFWPLKTDSYVIQDGLDTAIGGAVLGFTIPGMVKLETFLYSGLSIDDSDVEKNRKLTFSIKPNTSTVIWENIILEHMRSEHPECAQCESFYQETLIKSAPPRTQTGGKGASGFERSRRYPAGFMLKHFQGSDEAYSSFPSTTLQPCPAGYLPISTKHSPPIKAYGGYDKNILLSLGITNETNKPSISGHPEIGSGLPILPTRHYFGYPTGIYCYLNPIYLNDSGNILFDKGTFHPVSGWIPSPMSSDDHIKSFADTSTYTSVANKDSSYKFKTDQLDTLVFKGLGVYNLRSSINLSNNLSASVYPLVKQSTIVLSAASGNSSFTKNPLDEHDSFYGYRDLNLAANSSSQFNLSDEYLVDILNTNLTSFDCGKDINTITYGINRSDLDDLVIKDIEIKINNLNYPNPKQLCVWLEVERDQSLDDPETKIHTNFTDLSKIANTGLRQYMQNLRDMNSYIPDNPKKKKLYLLNRDNIDNFSYNFSLKFSDDVSCSHSSNYNNIYSQSHTTNSFMLSNIDTILDYGSIRPTISATGYSDVEAVPFKEAVIRNELFDINNSFLKFNNIPLKNTRFTLYIGVYDEYDNLFIKDNYKLNNALLGVTSTTTRPMPNILSNAICSWDLIIHTNKIKKFIPSDPMGTIDRRSSAPSFNRCNFIANFKDKKYLIPQANLNAPYNYISNINSCAYTEEEFSTVTRFNTVEFPTWAFVQITAAMTPVYGGGGFVFTGDPSSGFGAIYQYFTDVRQQNQSEAQARKTQRGRYTNYGFGNPDKVLINISQDGDIWYKLEVPIYRYINSYVLTKNKYQYLKLSKDIFPFLSRCSYKFLSDNDIKSLPQDTNNADIMNDFWKKNNISGFDPLPTQQIFKDNNKKLIKIKDIRAYYLFDTNEEIAIYSPTPNDPNYMETRTILHKGIFNFANENYTVFYLDADLSNESYLTKKIEDTLVIFKNNLTTQQDGYPMNKWGLEKPTKPTKIPDRHFNTLGEGSYGRGTELVRESAFTYLEDQNQISPIYKMLDHKKQYAFNFNKITIYPLSDASPIDIEIQDQPTPQPKETIRGYPWSFTEDQTQIIQNYTMQAKVTETLQKRLADMGKKKQHLEDINQKRQIDEEITLDEAKQMFLPDLKAYYSFVESDPPSCTVCRKTILYSMIQKMESELSIFYNPVQNYTFMDIRCDRFKSDDIPKSGEIVIENDWIIDQPKNKISSDDIDTIKTRLQTLETKTTSFQAQLEAAKQSSEFPFNIGIDELNALSVPDLFAYLSNLKDEPLPCASATSYTDEKCRTTFVKKLINRRIDEIRELSAVIESNDQYHKGVLPIVERQLETHTDGSLSIKETLNTDYYWIVIDPEQGCSLSKNMTAKVLSNIKYEATANRSTKDGAPVFGSDNIHLVPYGANKQIEGTDVSLELSSGSMKIKNLKKDEQKSTLYPRINSWQSISYYDKYMWINGGTRTDTYPLLDTLITVSEEFEIPNDAKPYGTVKVKDVINIENLNTIKIRFANIPRKVKEYDRRYSRYVPNYWGQLNKGQPSRGDFGEPWYSLDCWTCVNEAGSITDLPNQYKVMNEMLFRSYFGSIDGIEHKNSLMSDTKESWEWIPYEYDRSAVNDYEGQAPQQE